MFYNDLRDYHNNKFVINRLEEILSIYGWNTFMYIVTITFKNPVMSLMFLFDVIIYNYKYIYNNKVGVNHELNKINQNTTSLLRSEIYNKILNNIKSNFKTLQENDPIIINKYICYLINNGYLSVNKTIKYKNTNEKDKNFAYKILLGFGVCRNITSLTTDIFKILGYEAYDLILYNYFNKENMHAVTMVVYEEKIYFFDNLNKTVYDKKSFVLKDNKNSILYIPCFYLDNEDKYYKALKKIYNERVSFEKIKEVYEKYKQVIIDDYNLILPPKQLKRIYIKNKKNIKNFIKTYY